MTQAKQFKVHVRGKRWRYFDTIAEASAFCSATFARSGIVLSIVKTEATQ